MAETIQCGATTLRYEDTGSGEAVVFLHGAGLTHQLWDPQIEHFRGSYRCLAIDLRGHGGSRAESPSDSYLTEDHAADVASFLDALGIESSHIVGLSLGGMVALEIGLLYPGRVRSIVTIGTPVDATPNAAARLVLALLTRRLFRGLRKGGMEWMARKAAKRWTKVPAVREYVIEDSSSNDLDEFRRVWRGVVAYKIRDRLPQMKAPVLVIAGSRDINRKQARLAAALMSNAWFELVPGAGHITNRDAPDRLNALLDEWLESQRAQ